MKTKKAIDKQIALLRQHRDELDAKEFKKRIPGLLKMVGQTFVYRRNCYSCPGPGEYWPVFRKLLMVACHDGGATLLFKEVQTDCHGKATITTDSGHVGTNSVWPAHGWEACPSKEFDEAVDLAVGQIERPELYRAYWEAK